MRFTVRHFLLGMAVVLHLGLSLCLGFLLASLWPPIVCWLVMSAYAGSALYWRRLFLSIEKGLSLQSKRAALYVPCLNFDN